MFSFNLSRLEAELRTPAEEVLTQIGGLSAADGVPVTAKQGFNGLRVSLQDGICIEYQHKWEFFRGLALAKRVLRSGKAIEEHPNFVRLGFFEDVSRGAVLTVDSLKKKIRYLAAMGYNLLTLYIEDIYEVPEYPWFGHQRGRYTKAELKEIVAYGERFGITLNPSIQVLGHLEMPLIWPAFKDIKDSSAVLYVGKPEVYEFIDTLFKNLCECFKTRLFYLCMDEAHTMGLGRRLDKEGYVPKSELLAQHMERVGKLCEKYGISPIISSDMFFRPFAPGYYTDTGEVPQEVIDRVPPMYRIMYWDYYNCEKSEQSVAKFHHMIQQHKRFHNPIMFLGGAWKWMGFAPNNAFSLYSSNFHLNCCLQHGIDDISLATFGDDGSEASMFSNLPTLVLYAEKLYKNTTEKVDIEEAFMDLFGLPVEAFLTLDCPNQIPDGPRMEDSSSANPCKYLFYNDPLNGRLTRLVKHSYKPHFAECEKRLAVWQEDPQFGYIFETLSALCRVLKNLATLPLELREAYAAGDKAQLEKLADSIPGIVADLDDFTDTFQTQWLKENKLFGLETLELRFGGQRGRLVSTEKVLRKYLSGKLARIEPLETPLLYPNGKDANEPDREVNSYAEYLYDNTLPAGVPHC